jgi:hypothetical protein
MSDLSFENHGSIVLMTPNTTEGREFIDEFVPTEPWQWMGNSIACDPRMAFDLYAIVQSDHGLSVEGL